MTRFYLNKIDNDLRFKIGTS